MSQPNPCEDLKDIILEFVSLKIHDKLKAPESSVEELLQNAFMLRDDQLPSPFAGLSSYHRENLSFPAAVGGQIYDHAQRRHAFADGLSPAAAAEIESLLDWELQKFFPRGALPAGRMWDKAVAIVKARGRQINPGQWPPVKKPQCSGDANAHHSCDFQITVNNFTPHERTEFLLQTDFIFYFNESFDKLLNMLCFRTQGRDKPPPKPRPNYIPLSMKAREMMDIPWNADGADGEGAHRSRSNSVDSIQSIWDDSTDRPSLEYSEGVLARVANDMSGYTLKDGPWIYQVEKPNGTFGPQHLLANEKDFKKMIDHGKRNHALYLDFAVKIIHSQDRIGLKRWTKQQQENEEARKQRQSVVSSIDEDEFERVIVERYGAPSQAGLLDGLEKILSYQPPKDL